MSAEPLHFMMGEYRAEIPCDRSYWRNHMWGQEQESGTWRFGLTAYAVRLLQDVYFLDWALDAPAQVSRQQEIGSIESKKAESSLYAPIGGNLLLFNDLLMDDPSAINLDKYGEGWLMDIQGQADGLMTPDQYVALLEEVWQETQRTIKGQLN